MAWSKLEDTFQDDAKFRQLSEHLGLPKELGAERGMALAQGHVARLWSWASRHAPDGVLPQRGCDEGAVERVCGWPTAKGRLYRGLVAVGFIDEVPTPGGIQREIHRFWERAESHKAAQRKRNQRSAGGDVSGQSRPQDESDPGPSRLEERTERRGPRGEDREDKVPADAAQKSPAPGPEGNDLGTIQRSQIPLVEAERLYQHYQQAAVKHRRGSPPMMAGPLDRQRCQAILWLAGWDHGQPSDAPGNREAWAIATHTVSAYLACSTEKFWTEKHWPLWLLAEPKNFEVARGLASQRRLTPVREERGG